MGPTKNFYQLFNFLKVTNINFREKGGDSYNLVFDMHGKFSTLDKNGSDKYFWEKKNSISYSLSKDKKESAKLEKF